jgi:lipopolysaccharide export system permease protein
MLMALLAYMIYSNFISVGNAWMAQGKLPSSIGLWPIHGALLATVVLLLAKQAGAFRKTNP